MPCPNCQYGTIITVERYGTYPKGIIHICPICGLEIEQEEETG